MTEAEARQWLIAELNVSRETMERLELFLDFLQREAQSQNLIAASTLETVWSRHIVDSAQLLKLLPASMPSDAKWLDLGSGAGFPGLVIAILSGHYLTLVESRARRIDYLERAVLMLGLDNVTVKGMALEKMGTSKFDVISARAFAPLPRLLSGAARFSTENSYWLLPKGKNAVKEYQEAKESWSIDFDVIPSITDENAGILTGRLRGNTPKKRVKGR